MSTKEIKRGTSIRDSGAKRGQRFEFHGLPLQKRSAMKKQNQTLDLDRGNVAVCERDRDLEVGTAVVGLGTGTNKMRGKEKMRTNTMICPEEYSTHGFRLDWRV